MAMGVPLGLAIAMSARTRRRALGGARRGSGPRAHRLLHDLARRDPGCSASGCSSRSRSRPTAAAGSGSCAWSRRARRSSSRAPCSATSCATACAARSRRHQGDELLVIVLVVVVGIVLVHVGASLARAAQFAPVAAGRAPRAAPPGLGRGRRRRWSPARRCSSPPVRWPTAGRSSRPRRPRGP